MTWLLIIICIIFVGTLGMMIWCGMSSYDDLMIPFAIVILISFFLLLGFGVSYNIAYDANKMVLDNYEKTIILLQPENYDKLPLKNKIETLTIAGMINTSIESHKKHFTRDSKLNLITIIGDDFYNKDYTEIKSNCHRR